MLAKANHSRLPIYFSLLVLRYATYFPVEVGQSMLRRDTSRYKGGKKEDSL